MEEVIGYEERFDVGLENVASYRDFFSAEEWAEITADPPRTSLTEDDALRMARALDEYELVTVVDLGGSDEHGYWVIVRDYRFALDYEIASHCDYWDFIAALVDHKQYIGPVVGSSSVGPSAATSGDETRNVKFVAPDLSRCLRRMLHTNRRLRRQKVVA